MTLTTGFITFLNIVISGIALFAVFSVPPMDPDARFNNTVARMVVREQLDSMPQISSSQLKFTKGCVERGNDGGTVIGSADASNQVGLIEGVPVIDSSAVTYSANVSSHCTAANPYCYKVNNIEINGSRKIAPRL
jgi:hypothetical protein